MHMLKKSRYCIHAFSLNSFLKFCIIFGTYPHALRDSFKLMVTYTAFINLRQHKIKQIDMNIDKFMGNRKSWQHE